MIKMQGKYLVVTSKGVEYCDRYHMEIPLR